MFRLSWTFLLNQKSFPGFSSQLLFSISVAHFWLEKDQRNLVAIAKREIVFRTTSFLSLLTCAGLLRLVRLSILLSYISIRDKFVRKVLPKPVFSGRTLEPRLFVLNFSLTITLLPCFSAGEIRWSSIIQTSVVFPIRDKIWSFFFMLFCEQKSIFSTVFRDPATFQYSLNYGFMHGDVVFSLKSVCRSMGISDTANATDRRSQVGTLQCKKNCSANVFNS